ncbi:Arabinanase/levansucrase/invertase [Aspergillus saccharolyticus JOP 1030-1]|uniref:Arabinanase/levansucrase/invertase n=1 Tax=Aspergillus saccharolyticus JOP 1030-1 TaxID=1450539 RepID=A0A318ZJ85_9EURO|nr:Arabinanase/levansucrase/invertase [Aspergillus saccharolyticus JOP 1030-1]PYH40328.1 Arabinanase/levansucrase/invertase [Aspergillus saccharolyticus JOP 1030-1]
MSERKIDPHPSWDGPARVVGPDAHRWGVYEPHPQSWRASGTSTTLPATRTTWRASVSTSSPVSYTYTGQLTTEWSIDATVLRTSQYDNYLVFSCFHGVTYQSLCIQKLGNDYVSLTGNVSVIPEPTEAFETHRTPVNEGPAALYLEGTTYLAYSASYCWTPYYCVALLPWDSSTEPTSKSAWAKGDSCALSSAKGNYGTGHNSFFQSPDASETWIAYHATSKSGGACDNTRYTVVRPVGVSNGKLVFETPAAFSAVFNEPS